MTRRIALIVSSLLMAGLMVACGTTGVPQDQYDEVVKGLEACQASANQKDEELAACQKNSQSLSDEMVAMAKASDALVKERQALMAELQADLKALVDAGTLKVVERGGLLVVQLDNSVLFKSGSVVLGGEGLKTLEVVAGALKKTNRRFLVAGHTDDLPVNKKKMGKVKFESNWDLSTARAETVLKALRKGGVPPKHLIVAGFAANDPIGDNSTDEGKKMNRRIELILMPDMGKLLGAVKKAEG